MVVILLMHKADLKRVRRLDLVSSFGNRRGRLMVGRGVIRLPLDERFSGRVHWVLPRRFRGAEAAAALHPRSSPQGS